MDSINQQVSKSVQNAMLNVPLAMKINAIPAIQDSSITVVSAQPNANQDVVNLVPQSEDLLKSIFKLKKALYQEAMIMRIQILLGFVPLVLLVTNLCHLEDVVQTKTAKMVKVIATIKNLSESAVFVTQMLVSSKMLVEDVFHVEQLFQTVMLVLCQNSMSEVPKMVASNALDAFKDSLF